MGTTPENDVVSDDSNCSTPYVSAPSSPGGRSTAVSASHFFATAQPPPASGFFYSAPTSPMHYVLLSSASPLSSARSPFMSTAVSDASSNSFEFEFSSRFDSPSHAPELGLSMSSADELFLNGQIRPMKLCAHLNRPQGDDVDVAGGGEVDDDEDGGACFERSSRDLRFRCRSQRRRARSMSPLRTSFDWSDDVVTTPKKSQDKMEVNEKVVETTENTASGSASSSRCSSAGRSSKRWVFLKDFLRSKSEGRSNNKFWQNISFSPGKEKEKKGNTTAATAAATVLNKEKNRRKSEEAKKSTTSSKRRSAHEMHYAANRAQAEEMRKKTFLPYRQGLLGCLGFNSKSYGAINGFARALNPVSSG